MAAGGYLVGRSAFIGFAVNAATAGETFGGTPGGYDYMRVKPKGFKLQPRQKKEIVDELGVDTRDTIDGGLWWSWSADCYASYSFREKPFHLWAGGAITTTGASAPYTHAIALSDKPLWGALKAFYADNAEQANEICCDTLSNVLVTGISGKESPEGGLELSLSGLAVSRAYVENVASFPAINESEVIKWDHLAPTLNAVASYELNTLDFNLSNKMEEGVFDHAATTPRTMKGSARVGHREITWHVDVREKRAEAETLVSDTTTAWSGANSLIWNNGGLTTAARELSLIFGNSKVESADVDRMGQGRSLRTINLRALDASSPRVLAIQFKNARATITT